MDNNPSPGNRAGGVTTIEEKSLGAVAKGGSTPLQAVYRYAEPVTATGLVFMDTPGYDPVSVTGIVAGGANLVCFTTGRGSVFGCKPAPSLKLATTTAALRADGRRHGRQLRHGAGRRRDRLRTGRRPVRRDPGHGLGAAAPSARSSVSATRSSAPWQLGAVM